MSEVIKVDFANRRPSKPRLQGIVVLNELIDVKEYREGLIKSTPAAIEASNDDRNNEPDPGAA
jgi:hypothetical protein